MVDFEEMKQVAIKLDEKDYVYANIRNDHIRINYKNDDKDLQKFMEEKLQSIKADNFITFIRGEVLWCIDIDKLFNIIDKEVSYTDIVLKVRDGNISYVDGIWKETRGEHSHVQIQTINADIMDIICHLFDTKGIKYKRGIRWDLDRVWFEIDKCAEWEKQKHVCKKMRFYDDLKEILNEINGDGITV